MQSPVYLNALLFAGFLMAASFSGRSFHPFQRQASAFHQQASVEDSVIGNWTGTSTCQVRNFSCRDENVIFHILPGNSPNHYLVKADKIISGQAIDMGDLDFAYDKASHTLTCAIPTATWVLVVKNRHIDGTLTTTDKVLFKKLSLSKAG